MKKFIFISILFFLFAFQTLAQLNHYYHARDYYQNPSRTDNGNYRSFYSRGFNTSNFSRGNYYLGQGNYDKAIQYFTKALNEPNYLLKVNSTDIYYKLGYTKYEAQQFDDAIVYFNMVIANRPNYAVGYNSKGLAEFYSGNYKAAFADINHAIALDPHRADSYYFRSAINYHFQDYKLAIADCDTALMHNPTYMPALKRRANAKYITLDFDGAVSDYTKALKHDGQNARLYFSRGLAYEHLNKLDDAAQDFYKAHTLDENNQEYTDNLSQVSANPKTADKITRLEFSAAK